MKIFFKVGPRPNKHVLGLDLEFSHEILTYLHGLDKLFPIDELRCTCLNIRALDARAPMEPRRERVFVKVSFSCFFIMLRG